MKRHPFNPQMDRRKFLKLGLAGTAATAIGTGQISRLAAFTTPSSPEGITPVYRTLGRTGLKISMVSFGAMLTPEPEVIRASLDYGVNYIDTARRYMNGKNEEIVAKAIKGFRPKLFLATKTKGETREQIFQDMEKSLRALDTNYVDVYQLHNLTSKDKDRAFDPQVREALRELKRQGKARFFGVTTHTDQAMVINAIADDPEKFFDTILVGYNFKNGIELKEAIARAANNGIGIVAMKTQAGGYQTKFPRSDQPPPGGTQMGASGPAYRSRHTGHERYDHAQRGFIGHGYETNPGGSKDPRALWKIH